MALRRPLVRIGGVTRELPDSDTLPGQTGSGTVIVDFGSPGTGNTSVAITGQSAIVAGSEVDAWIVAVATADHSADEHIVENIRIRAGVIVPGVGFTIFAFAPDPPVYGKWSVHWSWN